jgi:hypothetical protein
MIYDRIKIMTLIIKAVKYQRVHQFSIYLQWLGVKNNINLIFL